MVDFYDHFDDEYGKRGEQKREIFDLGYETFKLGVLLEDLRKQKNLIQEQLAEKCGTTKTYITGIEKDAGDIRLSRLFRIIRDGLGAKLNISISD